MIRVMGPPSLGPGSVVFGCLGMIGAKIGRRTVRRAPISQDERCKWLATIRASWRMRPAPGHWRETQSGPDLIAGRRPCLPQAQAFAHLAAGRYEAALPWSYEALRKNGGLPALRFKLSLCDPLGRLDEADECLRRLREPHPEPTIGSVMHDVSKGRLPRHCRPDGRRIAQSRCARWG